MLRPTRQQIDDEIIDRAAALFARHGFKETSVQRIADAVGYSKTGLLHHYPTKEALQAAVIDRCLAAMHTINNNVAHLTPGPQRDRAALTALAHAALCRPGFVALLLSSLTGTIGNETDNTLQPMHDALRPVGEALINAFALTTNTDDIHRAARVTGALGALAVTRIALRERLTADTVDLLIDVSYDALGHHTTG